MPYCSWCDQCVKGRARDHPHRRRSGEPLGLPVVQVDFSSGEHRHKGMKQFPVWPHVMWRQAMALCLWPRRKIHKTSTQSESCYSRWRSWDAAVESSCSQMLKQEQPSSCEPLHPLDLAKRLLDNVQSHLMAPMAHWRDSSSRSRTRNNIACQIRTATAPLSTWLIRHAAWVVTRYQKRADEHRSYQRVHKCSIQQGDIFVW